MKRLLSVLLALSCAIPAFAAGNEKEVNRVKDSGVVLKEILDIPDDIPKDILDRAECVIVLPSVLKAAIGIGGSFRPRSYGLPKRRALYRAMGRPRHVRA